MSDYLDQRGYGKKRKLNAIKNLNPKQNQNPIEMADPYIELLSDIFDITFTHSVVWLFKISHSLIFHEL